MNRTTEDIRDNIDHVGCDNQTALEMCEEIDRLRAALDGVVRVSFPVELDGEQWIAIPRAAWMAAAEARKQ